MKKTILPVLFSVAMIFTAFSARAFAISANAVSGGPVVLTHTNQDVLEKSDYTYFYKNSCEDDSYSLLRIMSAGPNRTLDITARFAEKDISGGRGEYENSGLFLTFWLFFNYDKFYGMGIEATAGIYGGEPASNSGITFTLESDFAPKLTKGIWNKIALPISTDYAGYAATAFDSDKVDTFKFLLKSTNNEIATSFLLSKVAVEKLDLPATCATVAETSEYKGDFPNLNNAFTAPVRDAVNFSEAQRAPLPEPSVNGYTPPAKSSNVLFVSSIIVCAVAICVSVTVISIIYKKKRGNRK